MSNISRSRPSRSSAVNNRASALARSVSFLAILSAASVSMLVLPTPSLGQTVGGRGGYTNHPTEASPGNGGGFEQNGGAGVHSNYGNLQGVGGGGGGAGGGIGGKGSNGTDILGQEVQNGGAAGKDGRASARYGTGGGGGGGGNGGNHGKTITGDFTNQDDLVGENGGKGGNGGGQHRQLSGA